MASFWSCHPGINRIRIIHGQNFVNMSSPSSNTKCHTRPEFHNCLFHGQRLLCIKSGLVPLPCRRIVFIATTILSHCFTLCLTKRTLPLTGVNTVVTLHPNILYPRQLPYQHLRSIWSPGRDRRASSRYYSPRSGTAR
jgi:hypothetical protein